MRKISLSGFPEWLPQERALEIYYIDILYKIFTLHGFHNIETRSVEPIMEMANKGHIDKEIYIISRYGEKSLDNAKKNKLALHFDLTVPLARYIKDNCSFLEFPFKRFQIQKVWRGERPQNGRYREFTQVDIDILDKDNLSYELEAELLTTIDTALNALPLPGFTIKLSNRKIAEGFCKSININNFEKVLRLIDKLGKINSINLFNLILKENLNESQARSIVTFASIKEKNVDIAISKAKQIIKDNNMQVSKLFEEGCFELSKIVSMIDNKNLEVNFSIVRGLDYYTGTVYETDMKNYETLGSICSGGRYDSLIQANKKIYSGIGISIGLSRLLSCMIGKNLISMNRQHPAVVYVISKSIQQFDKISEIAHILRSRGIPTERSFSVKNSSKQIKKANMLNIPYIWFINDDNSHIVKDMRNGGKVTTNPKTWNPKKDDLIPKIITKF